jgi:hypothetical protein
MPVWLIPRVGVGTAMLQDGLRKALDFNTTVNFMESVAGGCASSPRVS